MCVVEVVQRDGTVGGDEVVVGVVAVVDPGGGLESQLLRGEPLGEVVLDGLVAAGADADAPRLRMPAQRLDSGIGP